MLWYKLCVVLILFSSDVFGYWHILPNAIPSAFSIARARERRTTTTAVSTRAITEEPATKTTEDLPLTTEKEITTAEPTEKPTTSTESPAMCNTSLQTKHDLLLIFNYFEEGLKINEKIIDSFHSEAVSVRDKHLYDIAVFQKLFLDKPAHLKHILEDIRDTRQQLLPFVEDISQSLNQYPELLDQFNKNQENLLKVLNNFDRQLQICKLTCGDKEVFVQREMILKENMPYDDHEFYCGSIADVRADIQLKLTNFSENQQIVLKDQLERDNVMYAKEIEQLKIKLKDVALKEFGYTMYDILELQDVYYHFSEEIKTGDIEATLNEVKQNIAQMNPKLLSLEIAVQKLTKYCRGCSNKFMSRQSDQTQEKTFNEPSSVAYNLLDELTIMELQRLKKDIKVNYSSIFEDLVKTIREANTTNAYIDDIKPIQKEVMAETKHEFEELDKVIHLISTKYLLGLLDLAKQSTDVLANIDETIQFVEEYIK